MIALLLWQVGVRRAVSSRTEEGRAHLSSLLSVATVLSWDDPEVAERVQLSSEDPDRYYEEHGDAFGRPADVWPFAVLCHELERRGLIVRAGSFDAPTPELCARINACVSRCGDHRLSDAELPSVGSGDSVESFLDEVDRLLTARALVLVHLDDLGGDLFVGVQPGERFLRVDGIIGPGLAYAFHRWGQPASPPREPAA